MKDSKSISVVGSEHTPLESFFTEIWNVMTSNAQTLILNLRGLDI